MSILIKGMEMPKNPGNIMISIAFDGQVYSVREGRIMYEAVEVPTPHGRLIDADALMVRVERETPLSDVYEKTMRRYLNTAPTIIEAEEGE